ncbi:MAG: phage tail sheath C-terminal domain-containing protein [Leeuwenhoekiella sp.]
MAATYKTPGVYVEEISIFPPSVAQVATAIPAFIGYTEKATKDLRGDLNGIPTRISSLLEYVMYFGNAQPETTIQVTINDTLIDGGKNTDIIVDQPTTKSPFLMYYSMQMYFANGGGPCYIVSVGRYGDNRAEADPQVTAITGTAAMLDGLAAIEKYDEPTLLVFPDATAIGNVDDFYGLYNSALMQCNKLQDRFTIIDPQAVDGSSPTDANVAALREKLNLEKDYLKYGAVYYPFLKTSLDYKYDPRTITVSHYSYNADAYETIKAELAKIEDLGAGLPAKISDLYAYDAATDEISGYLSDLYMTMYNATGFDLPGNFNQNPTKKKAFLDSLELVLNSLKSLVNFGDSLKGEAVAAAETVKEEDPAIQASIDAAIDTFNQNFEGADKIDEVYDNLKNLREKMQQADTDTKIRNLLDVNALNFDTELKKLVDYTPLDIQTGITSEPTTAFGDLATQMTAAATEIKKVEGKDKNNGTLNGRSLSAAENFDNATYNKILAAINALPLTLPPSATMAGVYARVDGDRGVWKAPANVGLNYVVEATRKVTSDEQQDLNVHTTGKSINVIRSFTGKGILVWGARTLAGNDNEWRYVSVRRFFNMVEESVKKATEQFVFEPNDANTWVKVRAMIENFLNLQWRAGALAGAKPENAFFVRVGLGQTMTAEDILNGLMAIEIGMAVVRPAEFIVLKFSHKMQES